MGVVYRALDLRLGHHVALKCPRRDSRLNDSQIRRIILEARTTAKISHPYIVPLLDVVEHEGLPLLVMEVVDGSSLRQLLVAGRPLPIAEALKYSQEILEALGTAHSRNVLHRDVTPNNILIGKDGHARLTDFGLAYLLLPPDELSEATTASMGGESRERIAGTPGYIAPERILGKPGDHRADLFSVGVVMHEMCAGEPAFRASEQGGIIDAIMHRETAPLSRLNYEVPEELERIVRKALSKKVDERYQTHSDMLADVRALRRRFESGSLDSAPAVTPPRKKLRRLWISAAAVVLVAAAIAIWFLWPRPPAPLPESVSTRVSADPGWESEPAISPQGDTIAYSSRGRAPATDHRRGRGPLACMVSRRQHDGLRIGPRRYRFDLEATEIGGRSHVVDPRCVRSGDIP
jgi:serine/threonine-protein kinase